MVINKYPHDSIRIADHVITWCNLLSKLISSFTELSALRWSGLQMNALVRLVNAQFPVSETSMWCPVKIGLLKSVYDIVSFA